MATSTNEPQQSGVARQRSAAQREAWDKGHRCAQVRLCHPIPPNYARLLDADSGSETAARKRVALRARCVSWESERALHERQREMRKVISRDDGGEGAAAREVCANCVYERVGVDLRTRDDSPIDRHVDAATHNSF